MIRWVYFLILVYVAVVLQTTVVQVLWLRTALGYVGPELLASVAVFVALSARSGTDAALAGWVLGFALDLTGSGGGMGLLALLYAAGGAGLCRVREAVFRDRAGTQVLLALLFCLFVYQLWTAYDVLSGQIARAQWPRQALRAAALAAYTAVLTPLVCAGLKRLRRLLLVTPSGRERR